MVEILQYFKIINILGLQNSAIASVVTGTSFEWIDLVACTAGIVLVLIMEKIVIAKIFSNEKVIEHNKTM